MNSGGIQELIISAQGVVGSLIPITIALALLVFFWGVARFILNAADSAEHENGRRLMIWGIIALFVIVTLWGLVGLLQDNLL